MKVRGRGSKTPRHFVDVVQVLSLTVFTHSADADSKSDGWRVFLRATLSLWEDLGQKLPLLRSALLLSHGFHPPQIFPHRSHRRPNSFFILSTYAMRIFFQIRLEACEMKPRKKTIRMLFLLPWIILDLGTRFVQIPPTYISVGAANHH